MPPNLSGKGRFFDSLSAKTHSSVNVELRRKYDEYTTPRLILLVNKVQFLSVVISSFATMKKILLIAIATVLASALWAQGTFQPRELADEDSNVGIVYEKEFAVDLRLHTNGWAIGGNIGQLKTYYLTRFYHFEFGEIKHPKEYRSNNDASVPSFTRTSRSFIYGKQNNFLVLRAGIGEKRYFSEKAKEKGVAVGMTYLAGPALGLLKPYYLEVIRQVDNNFDPRTVPMRYSEENASLFLDNSRISGASGFGKGWSEISPRLGVHGKVAVHFDWGAFDEVVKAVEAGLMFDLFFQDVEIMVENENLPNVKNRPYFINLFLNVQLGKRW